MNIDFKIVDLKCFLEHKTLYYDKIDFSIVENAWKILSVHLDLPYVVHIVGTNGKGSTGRSLAHYLSKIGKKTLHYSSPHISKFNERIWINGSDVSDEILEKSHQCLQKVLPLNILNKLTYFEYTTLLALHLSSSMDYIILEAGLGGEFDATNIIKNDLSLITTIDLDHQSFLGDNIKDISLTKMRSCDNVMILGNQIHNEVYAYAKIIKEERIINLKSLEDFDIDLSALKLSLPKYLLKNLSLCIAALKYLGFDVNLSNFDDLNIQGRCQKIAKNITIDVGHNPLAAGVIADEFKGKKINLIYNSYADKDYEEVLKILKPIIKSLNILSLEDERVVSEDKLVKACQNMKIEVSSFNELSENEEYLVFGSFLVVEKFLTLYKEMY